LSKDEQSYLLALIIVGVALIGMEVIGLIAIGRALL
jgi:hypothetical protein